ncbi:hypothetical protein OB2597_09604 [Pseudooceanicola batsensis HTCC2597]|uniref:Uncharacterized protein n=1 Tax=Pseudooceanicola batsensis (strain ATCC BAA-863 / DSM 15984 / KCTC 12145 / HTCC2597) TaxID=252305 RepID=A3TV43_PSEBH|nr:hypothetical protein [Pseudooceanicola batsensis]EAQ04389.1 hypothetical protein OB2597_09604 [Pseudooceanicola batsensis HTCC2597]
MKLAVATVLALGLMGPVTASAGSHTPEEAALDDVISGCIRIVAQGIPPVRALPGANEVDGKWKHVTDVSTTTFDPAENWCDIHLPSMAFDREAALDFVRNAMLAADITDLQSRDVGRVMAGLIGEVNGAWVHIGVGGGSGGSTGSQFIVKGQK